MTISPAHDDGPLAGLVGAIAGVTHIYSARPTVLVVATTMLAATGRVAPSEPLIVTPGSVRVRVGIDHTRSTAEVGADVYTAIEEYLRSTATELPPLIEIEIATIR